MKLKSFCLEFITAIQINLLSDMKLVETNYIIEMHIESPIDLEIEMCRYDCQTKDELNDLLWNDYDTILILDYEEDSL